MAMKTTIERLETLRNAMTEAAETVKVEQDSWSVLTNSKEELEQSLKVNGETPSEAQEKFWEFMDEHKTRFRRALKNLEERENEFSQGYEAYRKENT